MTTERLKDDHGKPRFDLIDPVFELDLAKVLAYGAKKYKANSWKEVELDAYIAAFRRHLNSMMLGEFFDDESGLPHVAHMAANAMFIHYLARKNPEQAILTVLTTTDHDNALKETCDNIVEAMTNDSNIRPNAVAFNNINPVAGERSENGVRHHSEELVQGRDEQKPDEEFTSKVPDRRGTHQRL